MANQQSKGQGVPIEQAMQEKMLARNLENIKYKLFIMSGKGGVGKSSVTANLAAALVAKGFKVGILDVDLHGPSIPRLFGATGGRVRSDGKRLFPVPHGNNLSLISMDLFLDNKDQAVLWRGVMKSNAIRQFLTDVDWGPLDYLLIDSPPGTGDEHMTILETIPDAMAIVVTTPQELALADVRKALDCLHELKSPILGIVENMSSFICPGCGKEYAIFKKGGGEKLAETYNIPLLASIPLDPAAVESADQGVPLVDQDITSPAKDALLQLAERIMFATRPKQGTEKSS